MARRTRKQTQQNDIETFITQLDRLKSTPLGCIFVGLWQGLVFIQQAFNAGGCSQSEFEEIVRQTRAVFQLLPQEFSPRHSFDVQLIYAIKESWERDKQKLSHYLIPINGDRWGHQGVFLPVANQHGQSSSINFIHFPGNTNLSNIDLLDYPFLCHELAHNLYFFNDLFFRECFDQKLKALIDKLRLQSISDHGAAKTMSERIRQRIEAYWRPTANHKNWAHEIAMDLTAVWTCGPAYLATLIDEMDKDQSGPFFLTQEHPPNAVRVDALTLACQQLGWREEAIELKSLSLKWRRSKTGREINNHYVAFTNPDLIVECVQCVLATCHYHNLPKCNEETIGRIKHKLSHNETPDWGTELIIAAWLKYKLDEVNYGIWQESVIQDLLNSLTP